VFVTELNFHAGTRYNGKEKGDGLKLMDKPIYMDNHATTAVDDRVLRHMMPYFREHFGNAASRTHQFGWTAEKATDRAREQVAEAIGASPKEIVFTSGATESDNLAIKGVMRMAKGRHMITVETEHKAVIDSCKTLRAGDVDVTFLPVDELGLINLTQLEEAITGDTALVSVMHANNEVGVIQPIAEIGDLCRRRGILFHIDAAQSIGRLPFNVNECHASLVSISAHKLYGPKGVGGLYVRRTRPRIAIEALIDGGGHERGLRSGTLAVPLIVGFGEAVQLAVQELAAESKRLTALRNKLWDGLQNGLTHIRLNGHPDLRLPGNLNVSFAYVEGEALLMDMADIAVSSGSACTSDSLEPSYVLKAMGTPNHFLHSSIRFGLGRFNTDEEVDYTIEKVVSVVNRLRALSPIWDMIQKGEDPAGFMANA
jgi:cysteine desulfurase